MKLVRALVLITLTPVLPPAIDLEASPVGSECISMWLDRSDQAAACDDIAISAGLERHPRLCRSSSPEDAVVTLRLLNCRRGDSVPTPSAAWLQQDVQAEVKTSRSRTQLWASDRHSRKGAGRDAAERVLEWLEEQE